MAALETLPAALPPGPGRSRRLGSGLYQDPRGTAIPAAPVLLRQASLAACGGAGEDFEVSLPGEWEINPTLLHLLKTEYQAELGNDELLDLLDQGSEPADAWPAFERLRKACSLVPGFGVTPRVVLGNFSYAKLPMVMDLETATDTLVGSELISALAGDEQPVPRYGPVTRMWHLASRT